MVWNALRRRKEGDEEGGAQPFQPIGQGDAQRRVELLDSFEQAKLGWFWATDAQGRITYFSTSATQDGGWQPDEVVGQPMTALFATVGEDEADEVRPLHFLLGSRNSLTRQTVALLRDGPPAWWELSGKPLFDAQQVFQGYRGSAKDITAEREDQLKAARLSRYDTLTGLANRHSMNERLNRTLSQFRIAQRNCALFMMDLDRFKQVNDTLGHPAGDELLKQVASRLRRIVGEHGEIGRLGGDEFQVILPDMDDRGALGELAQRCIQMVSQPYTVHGNRVLIGASVGIAVAPFDGIETDELVSSADLALYAAKGNGRGQFRFFSSDLKDGANLRRDIEHALRDALVSGELALHYQPIVDANTNRVAAFEALMRWEHPTRGFIDPSLFISVAEETGFIKEMGAWALQQACRDAAEWPGDIRVAVNVSPVQFAQADLPVLVASVLKQTGLAPGRLELEITESVFLGDPNATQDMFVRLKKVGVRLALDDFGTGYSSLSYLRHAPYDKIKIDQSFVRGATEEGNNNRAILEAIIHMARSLSMDTVAEGAEAQDELDLVRTLGASHVQGYIFSRALPQAAVLERLGEGKLEYKPDGPPHFRAERKTMMRQIGAIHDDYRYQVLIRNLSRTGARIEGLLEVPVGTELVLDLGDGQLVVSTVRRSSASEMGVEFESPLVNDGAGGLCTRYRVSPYAMEAAGRPLAALSHDSAAFLGDGGAQRRPRFMQTGGGQRP